MSNTIGENIRHCEWAVNWHAEADRDAMQEGRDSGGWDTIRAIYDLPDDAPERVALMAFRQAGFYHGQESAYSHAEKMLRDALEEVNVLKAELAGARIANERLKAQLDDARDAALASEDALARVEVERDNALWIERELEHV